LKTDDMSDSTENVEDRRGRRGARGGLPIPMGKGGAAVGLPLLIVLVLGALFGGNLTGGGGGGGFGEIFNQLPAGGVAPAGTGSNNVPGAPVAADDPAQFTIRVFNDVQVFWQQKLEGGYRDARLVLYDDSTPTACGQGSAAAGPFYCPGDEKVYIDLSFYDQLSQTFKAPGDFAQAYVIAHEVGHHLQNVTGIEGRMRDAQRGKPEEEKNELSVRLELQADCFAGVWGNTRYTKEKLEGGDLEEAINSAGRVGDDYIQKNLGSGKVNPDSFTHGTSEQRQKWFRRGFDSGDPNQCDTFSVNEP
jgi:uncharacterized protein